MEKFNINKIMSQYGLQEQEVANLLWPMVKYPELGFKRVLRGETYLDSAQICALANYLQVPVSELFTVSIWHKNDNFYNATVSIGFMEVGKFLNRIDEIIKDHEQELLNK